jgi:hypothetical protein
MNKTYDSTVPHERRRFVAGSVSMSGAARFSFRFPERVANAK